MTETYATQWVKSSYSGGSGEACIETRKEVAGRTVTAVDIRDSKDVASSPIISVSPTTWSKFIESVVA